MDVYVDVPDLGRRYIKVNADGEGLVDSLIRKMYTSEIPPVQKTLAGEDTPTWFRVISLPIACEIVRQVEFVNGARKRSGKTPLPFVIYVETGEEDLLVPDPSNHIFDPLAKSMWIGREVYDAKSFSDERKRRVS